MSDPQAPGVSDSTAHAVLWIVPLLAAIVTPGLAHIVAERPFAARIELAGGITLAVGIASLAVFSVLSKGFRHRVRWSLGVTTIVTLVLFQWPTLAFAGRSAASVLPIPLLTDGLPVLLAVGLLWLAARLGGEATFAVLIGIGALAVTMGLVVLGAPNVVRSPAAPRGTVATPAPPDVLLLILDGYSRADMLDEHLGFDNTPFLADLEQLGFVVADHARPNYNATYASIASMLALDYVYDVGPITPSDHEAMRNALSGDSAMMRYFREAGYEIAYTENAWQGSHCGTSVDICTRDGLVERVLWAVGRVTIFAPLVADVRPNPFNTVSIEQLEALPEIVGDKRTELMPRLTVAHIIAPHPPLLLDARCNRLNTQIRRAFLTASDELIDSRQRLYADQIVCTNQKVATVLQQIIDARPDTLVMITGDHGSDTTRLAGTPFDQWTDEELAERMSILSAYRVPGCQHLIYPSITPVNGTRAITDCAVGTRLSPIDDNSYLAPPNWEGSVVDVSSRLDR